MHQVLAGSAHTSSPAPGALPSLTSYPLDVLRDRRRILADDLHRGRTRGETPDWIRTREHVLSQIDAAIAAHPQRRVNAAAERPDGPDTPEDLLVDFYEGGPGGRRNVGSASFGYVAEDR